MDNNNDTVPFSPILMMEFIRQTTVAKCLSGESVDIAVRFRLDRPYYDEIMSFPLKAQLIRLKLDYDEKAEILTVRTDEVLLNRFREQKSLVEIAGKYEGQYAERYTKFIEIVE